MEKKGTSVFSNSLIWFGAGVSIAEILTGTYFAPLGFGKAMAAILLGHLIGGLMLDQKAQEWKTYARAVGNVLGSCVLEG